MLSGGHLRNIQAAIPGVCTHLPLSLQAHLRPQGGGPPQHLL